MSMATLKEMYNEWVSIWILYVELHKEASSYDGDAIVCTTAIQILYN